MPTFLDKELSVSVLRLDALHPWIQGNKWFKLKPFEELCLQNHATGFVSMGGAFSNHLVALAYQAKEQGKSCILGIRGQADEWSNNPAVAYLKNWGAQLIAIPRDEFRESQLRQQTPKPLEPFLAGRVWVPMGGTESKPNALLGAFFPELCQQVDVDYVVLAVATGGTLAGILPGLPDHCRAVGIEVLKSNGFIARDIGQMLDQNSTVVKASWHLNANYHLGGYGKSNPALNAFCRAVNHQNAFNIEPIYTGKAFWAVSDLAEKGYFIEKSRILIVHTGGDFPWNRSLYEL